MLPFIRDGFACGDKAVHVVNSDQREDHLHRLAAAGIDTAAAQQTGQLELRTNTDAYLRDGRFDQDRMLDVFEQLASGNAKGGSPLSRIVCQMDWACEGGAHVESLVEFESRVNEVWRRHDDAVICVYDLALADRPRQLVVRTERDDGDRVRLSVQDSGVGFGAESADRLFEAFYTTKTGGMGIGLSVSRSIIESHQGRLWAEPNDGPGATFAFSIPRAAEGVRP